ncbi:hypothetical protein MPC4_110113 [Methylocella tundrae]|uniref:Uncharacterized protein n=1 Tax=Methylocella tundrae TaxID=227605 RepID=A0A8B6M367_METTU|nr:hypothetical protein MPC4_110113 [Methylocella tundrae]
MIKEFAISWRPNLGLASKPQGPIGDK